MFGRRSLPIGIGFGGDASVREEERLKKPFPSKQGSARYPAPFCSSSRGESSRDVFRVACLVEGTSVEFMRGLHWLGAPESMD